MLTKSAICQALAETGLGAGQHLLVHSSLRSLGPVDGGADAVIDALLELVGPDGTLAMPTFHHAPPAPYYDPRTTPSRSGMLTEVFRQRPGVQRSLHPTHPVAMFGPRAAEFLADHHRVGACGLGSPIDRLAAAGGYVVLLGVSHTANTTVHVGETHAGVKKFPWWDGEAPVVSIRCLDGSMITCRLEPSASCSLAFNAVDLPLRRRGCVRDAIIGAAGYTTVVKGMDVIAAVKEICAAKPDILFCTRTGCRRCCEGRAFALAQR